ncbi:hypothetical protein GCM10023114_34320 [Mycolicibacterium sediminis]
MALSPERLTTFATPERGFALLPVAGRPATGSAANNTATANVRANRKAATIQRPALRAFCGARPPASQPGRGPWQDTDGALFTDTTYYVTTYVTSRDWSPRLTNRGRARRSSYEFTENVDAQEAQE